MTTDVSDMTAVAVAADPDVIGVSVLKPDREPEPGWTVVERADGLRVRIDGVGPDSPAVAAVLAADLGLESVADRTLIATRAEALPTLLTRADVTALQVRALADAMCTLANDEFEALGRGRPLTADKLLAYIQAHPMAGDPAPMA